MKFLQDLVPGCNKVNSVYDKFVIHDIRKVEIWVQILEFRLRGKLLCFILDEIINPVQSLQRQVEVDSHKNETFERLLSSFFNFFLQNEVLFFYAFVVQFLSMKLDVVNPHIDLNDVSYWNSLYALKLLQLCMY